jgi:hypothetical protein
MNARSGFGILVAHPEPSMHDIPIAIALIISLFCGLSGWIALTGAGNARDATGIIQEMQTHAPTDARHDPGADGSDPLRPVDRAFDLKGFERPE